MGTADRHRAIDEKKWHLYEHAGRKFKSAALKESFYFDLDPNKVPHSVYSDNLEERARTNSTKVRINYGSVRWIGGELYAYAFNLKARREEQGTLDNFSGLMKLDNFTRDAQKLLKKLHRCIKSTRNPSAARKQKGQMTNCKKQITDKKPDQKYLSLKVVPYRPPKSGTAGEKERWRADFRRNMKVGDYYATTDGHINITKGLPGSGGGSAIATVAVDSKFCLTGKSISIPLYQLTFTPLGTRKTSKKMTFVQGNWYDSDGNKITGWVAKGVLR